MESVIRNWTCPNCKITYRSNGPITQTAMHHCPSLNGLFIPLVEDGTDSTNRINYREDYVGNDICSATIDGKVVSSISQERSDGSNGLTVFVPCAVVSHPSK